MKLSDHRRAEGTLLLLGCTALFLFVATNQRAQTRTPLPKPTGHVNDFTGVVDEKTRLQLENVLENVKQKAGIEFAIAVVESTGGQEIFDFSRRLALDWGVGALTSRKKSLLLVVSVGEKTSFTQFSKSVQTELPEGVLGEMGQRMRAPVEAGRFSEGLNAGVQYFVNSMAQKLGISADDFNKTPPVTSTASLPTTDKDSGRPDPVLTQAMIDALPVSVKTPASRNEKAPAKTKQPGSSVDDEAESEAVELTLTKPLEERIVILKAFLDSHPDSKSKSRATELLVSARAALGDAKLKQGDNAGGIEQMMLAIADAPANPSEKLFSGVISQIPLNLYLRGERMAASKAVQNIETKFGSDPRRLLAIAGFYLATEQGDAAARLATQAISLAPDLAEAHQVLGRAFHISLRLEDAAKEYKRALELDPTSKSAQRSLADLNRAFGKTEEALVLYRQQLAADPADKAAHAGAVLSLLDLGRTDEAKSELDKALQSDPRNVGLLAGAAYWFAAHNESQLAQLLGSRAVEIEPRYSWSQVAFARALIAQKKPLEAERALRFARQYGNFPTLDYELANALAAAGLYDEAAEVLMQSFSVKDNQIETLLAGRAAARSSNFIELLAPERRAAIFQSAAADTENNAKTLKALLIFATFVKQENNGGAINEESAIAAAKEFAAGDDAARVYRQLYAASRLLQKGIGFQTILELTEAARTSADAGLDVPAATVAVQADELREVRARAISAGGTPDVPDAPRNVLSNLLRGRIEDISGWASFNEDKLDDAVDHLKRAANILPAGTPAFRISLWHLGVALERQDKKEEALAYYIKSYNAGEPDPVRRAVIEQLYRKINGSLAGLDDRIGPAAEVAANAQPPAREITNPPSQPIASPEAKSATTPAMTIATAVTATPEAAPTQTATSSPEVPAAPTPQATSSPEAPSSPRSTSPPAPQASPISPPTVTPEATPQPSVNPTPDMSPPASPTPESSPVETEAKPARATVKITGRVKDANNEPIANVVVVLISPQGTVLASTTDDQGNYSFTVAPSAHSYRIIPSRDGFTFAPVDRILPEVNDDQKELDFIGRPLTQSVRLR